MLERLRGAASASEPRTQKAIYELGFSVMNPILVLLEVYKHEVTFTFSCISLFNISLMLLLHKCDFQDYLILMVNIFVLSL